MKELFKSLAAFQQEVPTIHKGTKGYGYSYADLPAIFEVINPLMAKHGLGFTQTVNGTQLCTTVFHIKSGEVVEGCADIPQGVTLKGMNDFQVLGSAITYMRRYQLSAMLGLVTDKDTDAGGQQTPTVQPKPQPKVKPELKPETAEWKKAINYLVDGGLISKVEGSYALSEVNKQLLMDAVLS